MCFGAAMLALAATTAVAAGAAGQAKVTYLAGGSVYVDAGTRAGLRQGDTLRVMRGGAVVAVLRAAYLSTGRAGCDTLSTSGSIRIDDDVVFQPHAASPLPTGGPVAAAPGATSGTDSTRRASASVARKSRAHAGPWGSTVRGRIGARLLAVSGEDLGVLQPSADFRLDARDAAGHADLLVDARGRTTVRRVPGPDAHSSRNYVQKLSLTLHDVAGRRRLVLGRQGTPVISGAAVLDGARAEWDLARWSFGVFSGAEPDPYALGLRSDILDHGVFATLRSAASSTTRWSVLGGGATSLAGGQPNRDFAFLQATLASERMTAFAAQEVDLARGWKRAGGEPALSLTSMLVNGTWRTTKSLSLNAGWDTRRNVLLFRDRETPETEFDDRYRTGGWLGAAYSIAGHGRVSADTRLHRDAIGGDATSYTGGAEAYALTRARIALRVRGTTFRSDTYETGLWSISAAMDPLSILHVDFTGGRRTTRDRVSGLSSLVNWNSAAMDLVLTRRWYATVSGQIDKGEGADLRQVFTGLSYRF